MIEEENILIHNPDRLSKLEMLKQASEQLDSNDPMLQYKAIRHIRGLSRERSDPLKWIHENHYYILDDVARKLQKKSSDNNNNNDATIIIESKLSLELLEPYLVDNGSLENSELKCRNCQKGVDIEWNICPECGYNLKHDCCLACGKNLEPSWKFCPHCGVNF
ncbi:MAG: zinc ribbon domain-containing protein [Methanosarcinales archaeon]|nr:zinc ribbon domain-containing protein [Methanosarcinales archaeon]